MSDDTAASASDPVAASPRDSVATVYGAPTIVSLSDVHGYLDRARSALLTLSDHDGFDPIVEERDDGLLHWAGNDYVFVFNGDAVDRGPDSAGCLALIDRLRAEAPDGRVRQHLGNHEWFCLLPNDPEDGSWYCDIIPDERRRAMFDAIVDGDLAVAYEGYNYTYSHAGQPAGVDPATVNDEAAAAAADIRTVVGTPADDLRAVVDRFGEYPVFDAGLHILDGGDGHVKGPGAGPLWLGFDHLPAAAPPQIVGHTRHEEPTRTGNVVCGDVVLNNRETAGGEAVLVETPDSLRALVRQGDGDVELREM